MTQWLLITLKGFPWHPKCQCGGGQGVLCWHKLLQAWLASRVLLSLLHPRYGCCVSHLLCRPLPWYVQKSTCIPAPPNSLPAWIQLPPFLASGSEGSTHLPQLTSNSHYLHNGLIKLRFGHPSSPIVPSCSTTQEKWTFSTGWWKTAKRWLSWSWLHTPLCRLLWAGWGFVLVLHIWRRMLIVCWGHAIRLGMCLIWSMDWGRGRGGCWEGLGSADELAGM